MAEEFDDWTVIQPHHIPACTEEGDFLMEADYLLVDKGSATTSREQNEHWITSHTCENAISVLADRHAGSIQDIRFPPLEASDSYPYKTGDEGESFREVPEIDEVVVTPPQRVDWGDAVQFYLVSHRWSPNAIGIFSYVVSNSGTQSGFIAWLMELGMKQGEAEYFNFEIEKEGIRRKMKPCDLPWLFTDAH